MVLTISLMIRTYGVLVCWLFWTFCNFCCETLKMLTTGFGEKSNQTGKSDFGYDLDKIKTAGFGYDFYFRYAFQFLSWFF